MEVYCEDCLLARPDFAHFLDVLGLRKRYIPSVCMNVCMF